MAQLYIAGDHIHDIVSGTYLFDKIIIRTSKGFENVKGAYHYGRLVREGNTDD